MVLIRAVKTDEGNAACRFFGFPEAFTTVEESVDGLVAKVRKILRKFSFLAWHD